MMLQAPASKPRPASEAIDIVRDFNRFYTRQLGLLDRGLLGSEFTLTEARVLYELANRDDITATEIARELGIDLGYLSRLLAKFERRRYIKRTRSPVDARQSSLHLTSKGRAAFDPLNRAAADQIAAMIDPMTLERRCELLAAMQNVQRLLQPTDGQLESEPYVIRPLRTGDIGWITHRQGVLYAQEYGWDATYEALVAEILAGFVKNFDSNFEYGWIAERDHEIVGSVFLVRASTTLAKLRLLYVEPSTRGLGIGRRLVQECVEFARAKGYSTLTLWTNDVLVSARRIYQAAGFRLTQEERHHSFGKDLVGQTWELGL
jgi:DNA-binding MarR family transcriptional regulator/N-acetylglutamate synthase-like GNAT family acetyltransferase